MAEQPKHVIAEAYLVIEPQWSSGTSQWTRDTEGHPLLKGAKIARVTQTRPTVRNGGVVTKIKFRIDAAALLPLRPEVVIDLHAGNAEVVEVEAVDPRSEEENDG